MCDDYDQYQCRFCRWIDYTKKDGFNWYCRRFGKYVHPSRVDECGSFEEAE